MVVGLPEHGIACAAHRINAVRRAFRSQALRRTEWWDGRPQGLRALRAAAHTPRWCRVPSQPGTK